MISLGTTTVYSANIILGGRKRLNGDNCLHINIKRLLFEAV